MLSRLVITFLPRSKHLLISWLQSPSEVILEARKIKSATVSTVSPSICREVMGLDAMIFVFWMLSFKPTFSLSSFTLSFKIVQYSHSYLRFRASNYRVHRGQQSGYMPVECGVRLLVLRKPHPSKPWFLCEWTAQGWGRKDITEFKTGPQLKTNRS